MSKTLDDHGIGHLLSQEVKLQTWLDVESALAVAQAEHGVIPREAAENIKANAKYENLDLELMDEIYRKVGHGFVPFVKVFVKACDPEAGKYIHYGSTTQNIQQSSQSIVLKQVNRKFLELTRQILLNLADMAEAQADSVMAGRTHGKHAIPITYGYKVACWISEILMSVERLEQLEPRVFTIMMGGAVGAFNSTGAIGLDVQKRVGELLEMDVMHIPSRAINSPKVEYINALALLANNFHKVAEEVFQTSIEEFGEVSEGFQKGTIGSSTMPHKINPKLAKGIIANAQKLYSLTSVGYFSSARPFEADSTSNRLFDSILYEAVGLMREAIVRMVELSATLGVNTERLYVNANINHGIDNSEYIMMKLAERLGKDQAHE
ncbi:MAG: adenylosuccinate lyase family protein, partial [Flavobacteriales bacterium]|nr:adenylosuccinate lyase family protein [Flavobacteriales bacterium]